MLIDAHHHLWSYNPHDYVWMTGAHGPLRRDFLIPELEAITRASAVDVTIAVQARQMTEETEWLLSLAAVNPIMHAVVGWVPLVDPAVESVLARFAANPHLKAVRHVLHDEPDDHYILRPDFNRGIDLLRRHNLAYDILIFERHLPQTIAFVDRHPNQVFILDHVAKPRIRDRVLSPWREQLHELALRPNVYCKLSGLATEADWSLWTPADLAPYFDIVLSAFGPARLMFGSDWPVVNLAGGYAKWLAAFRSFIAPLAPAEQAAICSSTAISAYNLDPAPKRRTP